MSEVLEISLREESVRQRLQETDVAISRLQDMLLQTQEQLNRRQEMKTKVKIYILCLNLVHAPAIDVRNWN